VVRKTSVTVALVALVAVFGATTGFAQRSDDPVAFQQANEKEQAEETAREEIAQDRVGFAARLVDRWRDKLADGGEEMAAILRQAPMERVWNASQARDFDAFRSALTGRPAIPNTFGDTDGDLVFTPVEPCRLFDTRYAAAGLLVAGVVRTFGVNGDMSGQGGEATGCGIPVDPLAVVVNLAAVSPTGGGNIRAWRYGDTVPNAAAMNYNLSSTKPALSNMVHIPVCYGCGTGLDISLRSDVSNVHVVGDIVGYFLTPRGLPYPRSTTFSQQTVGSTDVNLATITYTPDHSGYAMAVGTAWCNIGAGSNVIMGFGETTGSGSGAWGNNAVAANNGTGNGQSGLGANLRLYLTKGTATTTYLTFRRESGAGAVYCSGTLSIIEGN